MRIMLAYSHYLLYFYSLLSSYEIQSSSFDGFIAAKSFIAELQTYWYASNKDEKLKKVSKEILDILNDNKITAQYINYCSLDFKDWETAYYGNNYKRLQAVKKKYDNNNNIRHPQSIKI